MSKKAEEYKSFYTLPCGDLPSLPRSYELLQHNYSRDTDTMLAVLLHTDPLLTLFEERGIRHRTQT